MSRDLVWQASIPSLLRSNQTLRGGEWRTGTGGDGGPRGAFLWRNLGGSRGSTCRERGEEEKAIGAEEGE